MELGVRELLTIATVIGGIAATWGLVRSQLGRAVQDLLKVTQEIQNLESKTENYIASQEVLESRVKVITDILSPNNLEKRSRELEYLAGRVEKLDDLFKYAISEVDKLKSMHNGKHPPVN